MSSARRATGTEISLRTQGLALSCFFTAPLFPALGFMPTLSCERIFKASFGQQRIFITPSFSLTLWHQLPPPSPRNQEDAYLTAWGPIKWGVRTFLPVDKLPIKKGRLELVHFPVASS